MLAMADRPDCVNDDVAEIGRVLDALHGAADRADGHTYFSLFTADAVFIGTDVRERWPFPEFRARSEPIFASGRGWTYIRRHRHITVGTLSCGDIAWFDEVLDSAAYGTSRGTGVLVRTDQGWKVAQYALAHPIPNDVGNEVIARIKSFEALSKEEGGPA
jgi:hypothetical protein